MSPKGWEKAQQETGHWGTSTDWSSGLGFVTVSEAALHTSQSLWSLSSLCLLHRDAEPE